MKNIRQKIADFLERISIAIEPKEIKNTRKKINRKTLTIYLEEQELQIRELKESREDLLRQIMEFIDDVGEINNGNLAKRLKVNACFMGHFADRINSIVEDLNQAVQYLPPTHPLRKKYRIELLESDELK